MAKLKKNLNRIILLLFFMTLFSIWYVEKYSMDVIDSYENKNEYAEFKVLIASQGSLFKNELTQSMVERLKNEFFLQVIDVSNLSNIDISMYDAIFIIHTWEIWKPTYAVEKFIKSIDDHSRIYTVGTSGSGDLKHADVDGISSASVIGEEDVIVEQAVEWLDTIIP